MNFPDDSQPEPVGLDPVTQKAYPDVCVAYANLQAANQRLMGKLPARGNAKLIGVKLDQFMGESAKWLALAAHDHWEGGSPDGKSPVDYLNIEKRADTKKEDRRPLADSSVSGMEDHACFKTQHLAEINAAGALKAALLKAKHQIPITAQFHNEWQGLLVHLERFCHAMDDAGMCLSQTSKPEDKVLLPKRPVGAKDRVRDPWAERPKPESPVPAEDDHMTGVLVPGTQKSPFEKIAALRGELDKVDPGTRGECGMRR